MRGRSPGLFGYRALKPKGLQIQLIDKTIHRPDRIVLTDVIIQSFGEQNALSPALTLDESLHGRVQVDCVGAFYPIEAVFSHGLRPLQSSSDAALAIKGDDLEWSFVAQAAALSSQPMRRTQTEIPMLDHTGIAVADLSRSKVFYTKALAPLSIELVMEVTVEQTGLDAHAGFGANGEMDRFET